KDSRLTQRTSGARLRTSCMNRSIRLRTCCSILRATKSRIGTVEHNKSRAPGLFSIAYNKSALRDSEPQPVKPSELIYDWNVALPAKLVPAGPVQLNDETLRDGLQSPSVRDPSIQEKVEILHLMEALGIDSLDLGLPGAGARAVEHVIALAQEIVTDKMKIKANCAARTLENDIRPI